jgi:predicted GNAT family N-acyltransferase
MPITKLDVEDHVQYLDLRFQLGEHDAIISKHEFAEKYAMIEEQGGSIYVHKKDGKVIATGKLLVEIKFFDNVAHIEDVVVDKDHKGIGYGKAMVHHLLHIAKERRCYKVVLQCADSLEPFYESSGLTRSGISMVKFSQSGVAGRIL